MSSLDDMKKKRLQYMHLVYELTGANEHKWLNMWEVGEKLGFGGHASELTDKIVQYLHGEGLIKFQAIGGIFGITHQGIKEVERAVEHPDRPTEHFAPLATVNIIHVNSMVNSHIQQSGSGSTQSVTINEVQLADLKGIIEELKAIIRHEKLELDQKEEIEKEVQVLALEANSSKPKTSRIRDSLDTIKSILQAAAAGSTIAAKIATLSAGM